MTTGTFSDALDKMEERFIEEASGYNAEKAGKKPRARMISLIAAACAVLLLASGAVAWAVKKSEAGTVTSQPDILYFVALTWERESYDAGETIPVTLRVGAGDIGVSELKIWSYSDGMRLSSGDPMYLYAENGDFDPHDFTLRYPDYKVHKDGRITAKVEELPFTLPLGLCAIAQNDCSGSINISVKLSGVGFSQRKTVSLFYEIKDGRVFLLRTEEYFPDLNDEKF